MPRYSRRQSNDRNQAAARRGEFNDQMELQAAQAAAAVATKRASYTSGTSSAHGAHNDMYRSQRRLSKIADKYGRRGSTGYGQQHQLSPVQAARLRLQEKLLGNQIDNQYDAQISNHKAGLAVQANQLRSQQSVAQKQWGRLADWASDPNNNATDAEMEAVFSDYQNTMGKRAGLVNPINLRRAHEEADNVEMQITNISESFGKSLNVDSGLIASFLIPDGKTGKLRSSDMREVYKMFQEEKKGPSTQEMSAVNRSISRYDKMISAQEDNQSLFDPETGRMLDSPGVDTGWTDFTGGTQEEQDAYDNARMEYEKNTSERNKLINRQMGYAKSFTEESQPVAQAGTRPEVFQTTNGMSRVEAITQAQAQANKKNSPVIFIDPLDNRQHTIHPN